MSDRGPFPPFRDEPGGDLPPIGGGDPDQTQWMPGRPDPGPEPTGIMPPVEGGGAFEPGPPFGAVPADAGGPGGPIGPDDPALEFEEEPEPWYRQPGPLAALATGILALILLIVALVVLLGDDDGDDELTDTSLPPPVTTSTTLPLTVAPTAVPLPPPTEVVATEPPTTPV
ncbi:MAG: hypothetical protein H0W46_02260, partial [Acidimicrobiia bacterium]|nr:hypothetical protein [Acidimicrobiia bacterium]